MGRNRKQGLDYFWLDVDFIQDLKVRKLIKQQGGKAVAVYALLLCSIYKSGYYLRWDEELPFVISEQTGFDEVYIQEVIKSCLLVGLLNRKLFDSDKILTSRGIQERYKEACEKSKRKVGIKEFSLIFSSEEMPISSEEMPISSEEMPISSEEMPISSEEMQQSKVKKRRINSSPPLSPPKGGGNKKTDEEKFISDFVDEGFTEAFRLWLDYKRERRESYKGVKSLKVCYEKLCELSGCNAQIAMQIVRQSIASNYSGLFPLKQSSNGNSNYNSAVERKKQSQADIEASIYARIQQVNRDFLDRENAGTDGFA